MKNKLLENIVNKLIENGNCKSEDKNVILYGLTAMIELALNIITSIIIGIIFGMLIETIIFVISLKTIREYSGGYHARTFLRCYIISTIVLIIALIILKSTMNPILYLIVGLIGTIVILLISPQEDANKPLDDIEIKVYRKRTYIMTILNISVAIFAFFLGFQKIGYTICISIFVIMVGLIFSKVNNIKK